MQLSRRGMFGSGLAVAAAGTPLARALAAGRGPVVNKILAEDGRVWIAAMVEGQGPFFFVIDTGSDISFIEDSVAKKLGLASRRGEERFGIGGGKSDYSWYVAKEVRLANGTRFPNMPFAGTRPVAGADAIGAFGSGLFTSYDSDFDFVNGEWRAYPDGKPDYDGLTQLKSRFTKDSHAPRIELDGTIDGFDTNFIMDTGASYAAVLSGRAAARSGLWNDTTPYAPIAVYGFGRDPIPSRLVRAREIRIGEFTFARPLVLLNAPGTISMGLEGILGLGILELLDLSTKVGARSTLWARLNGRSPRPRSYSLSGLWLEETKAGVVIADVGTGSAAAAAGLRKGDVVKDHDLQGAIRAINGPPGKQIALTVETGGASRAVRYTLAPWL